MTFNGKRFDAEFLLTRTLHHGLTPTRLDLLDRYPYNHRSHCDVKLLWQANAMGLADVCDLLGVPSPKADGDGGDVAGLLAAEGAEAVARYCEGDVLATLACYAALQEVLV